MNTIPQNRFSINKSGVAPAAGGMNTFIRKPQLALGGYSEVENLRMIGPGFELRGGLTPHNQTAEPSGIKSLYSYKSDKSGVRKFFAQLDDGDVLLADEAPPASTVNDFGDVVMDLSALKGNADGTLVAGSWSELSDNLLHSNGEMQHLVWTGEEQHPRAVFWKASSAAIVRIMEGGKDYTLLLTDNENSGDTGSITTTIANKDGLWICCDFPASQINIDMGSIVADGSTTLKVQYYDGDDMADATTGSDGTNGLQQDGTITFTKGTAEYDTWMFGTSGYWYRLYLSAGDATETISFKEITYEGDWQALTNVMDQFDEFIIESAVEGSSSEFRTYAATAIDLSGLVSGDYLYFATVSPCWAVRMDVGALPSTTAGTPTIQGYRAGSWETVSNAEDGTAGMLHSGWMSWERKDNYWDKRAFNNSNSHMYWWRISFAATLSESVGVTITYLTNHDLNTGLGATGLVSTSWKGRGCYTFGKFPRDIYVSRRDRPNILNGTDFSILQPGDGRRNPVVAATPFHNELMVWQKEEGSDGGCLTLFEGYSPSTYGRLVLSTRLGTFSQKTIAILDGALISTRRDDVTQTLVFFLSHYGIFMTDGRSVKMISDKIQNYFDPSYAECITRGQEDKMWVGIDTAKKVLRVGLVSGTGQTKCNIFLVYDLITGEWMSDTFPTGASGTGIHPHCFREVEASSGDVYSLQYLGDAYGRVYRSNNLVSYDQAAASPIFITSKTRAEFSNGGNLIDFRELTLRAGSNSDYTLTKKIYENGSLDADETESFTMEDDESGDTYRERMLQRNHEIFHLSIELTMQDTEAGGDPPPDLYDYIYNIGSEIQKG
jgi:hypothetical protein